MYAMLGSRPEIAYAVSKVSQYCTNPDSTHWTAVKRIFDTSRGHPTVACGTESMEAEMAILMPTGELVRIESQ